MTLMMDDDVRIVAEFMQATVPAAKLRLVAKSINALAPILWDSSPEEVRAIALIASPISRHDPHIQPSSI
jgi:hypothetical protein